MPLQAASYNWDDVPEPTDEDLAEIDAALEAAPSCSPLQFTEAWLASYPVKQALAEVGMPDGSGEWLIRFTQALFAHTEAVAPYKDKAEKVFTLATQWHQAVGRQGWNKRGQLPVSLLRQMLDEMPIEAVARYVSSMAPTYDQQATVEKIEEWLFPLLDLDKARLAVSMVKAGTPAVAAADKVGISYKYGLAAYMKAVGVRSTHCGGGRHLMPDSVRERILALAAEGHGPKAVHETVVAEGADVKYPAVKMLIARSRAAQ